MNLFLNFLDLVAGIIVVFIWIYSLKNFSKLPEKIPTHFDPDNQPDAFGNKKWIFMYGVLGVLFFVGFQFALKDPEGFNYPVEITEENKNRQFTIALIALRVLLVLVLLVFLNLLDFSVRKSLNENAKPVATFATVLLTILLTVGIMIAVASKVN